MLFLSTLSFLVLQFLINISINLLNSKILNKIIVGLGDIFFAITMFLFPMTPLFFYFHPGFLSGNSGCGTSLIGPTFSQWIIGIPLVILLQRFLNKKIFKMKIKDVL